jgi:MFS family permease
VKSNTVDSSDLGEWQARRIYLGFLLLSLLSSSGITFIYQMLPTFYARFSDPHGVGWAVTGYMVLAGVSAAVCGRLADLLGRSRIAGWMIALTSVGAVISAFSHSLWGVVGGCALQGITGSLGPICFGMARELLPARRLPMGVSMIAGGGIVTAGVSYVAAGWVIDRFSIEGAFLLRVLLGMFAAAALLFLFPRRARPGRSIANIDFVQGLLFAPGLCGLLLVLNELSNWGLVNPRTLGLAFVSVVLLAYWLHHQRQQAHPLIDVRLLLGPRNLPAMLGMLLMGASVLQIGALQSLILQQPGWTGVGFGISAFAAGLLGLPGNLAPMITSPAAAALASRLGARTVTIGAAIAIAAVWGILAVTHSSFAGVLVGAFTVIALLGVLYPALVTLILQQAPPEAASEATGLGFVFLQSGSALGSQVIFSLLALVTVHAGDGGAAFPADSGFTLAFAGCAVITFAMVPVLALTPGRKVVDARG